MSSEAPVLSCESKNGASGRNDSPLCNAHRNTTIFIPCYVESVPLYSPTVISESVPVVKLTSLIISFFDISTKAHFSPPFVMSSGAEGAVETSGLNAI